MMFRMLYPPNTKPTRILGDLAALAQDVLGEAAGQLSRGYNAPIGRLHPKVAGAEQAWNNGTMQSRLRLLTSLETTGYAGPESIGHSLQAGLCDAEQRSVLSEAAAGQLAETPDSPILIYLTILGLIDDKRFEEAHQIVSDAMMRHLTVMASGELSVHARRKRARELGFLWRIVDSAARDQMSWATGEAIDGKAYHDIEFVRALDEMSDDQLQPDFGVTLAYAEPLLQGRHQDAYLERCGLAFRQATTLFQKTRAIRAMWRQGYRRVPDYGPAYELARTSFQSITGEIDTLIAMSSGRIPGRLASIMRLMRSAYAIAVQLGFTEEQERLRSAMIDRARANKGRSAPFIAANALSLDSAEHELTLELIDGLKPRSDKNCHDFFQWAMRMGEYERADAVFNSLSKAQQTKPLALPYVNILQRTQRFEEAERLVRDVHAHMLSDPSSLNHFTSHGLIRRSGELAFAAETARHYLSVPQPTDPQGVILVTPRNLEQLRRTPLTVLMEWKKMGWAVVPIYEGVLPAQKTGIEAIDRFACCIRMSNDLRDDTSDWMRPVEPVSADLDAGKLSWRDIDLSHAFWEEAAINRRLYTPVWSCPPLQRSLKNLANWTEKTAAVLENARLTFGELGLRVGTHVFSSFRLPDALVRFYCERYGDPRDFFCIHASNGYENYFSNFGTNLSSHMSMRNMTAYAHTRSSTFPTPEMVDDEIARHGVHHEYLAEETILKVRSRRGGAAPCAHAEAARARIAAWKAGGGHVACAFGKVVCDSGVPRDGGPSHSSMQDWINHTVECAADSQTLLLIKPHPHERREEIACFLNQTFRDLLPEYLPDNVMYLGHDWFEIRELKGLIDMALIYNSTTAIEIAALEVPAVVCSHSAQVDYPVGHTVPSSRDDYRQLVRFERRIEPAPLGRERAASWLHLMYHGDISVEYRYHTRQITNCVEYPPVWFRDDIERYFSVGDPKVRLLAEAGIATAD